jgi:hypothetical protein
MNVRMATMAGTIIKTREWCCYPEATPHEFLSAMEIEVRAATKTPSLVRTQVGVGEFVAFT